MAPEGKKFWIAVVLLIATILYQHVYSQNAPLTCGQKELSGVPHQIGLWYGIDRPLEHSILDMLGLDAYLNREYLNESGHIIWLYVGYYQNQRQGKGIHSPKHCYPGAGWMSVEKGTEIIPLHDDRQRDIRVNRLVFQKEGSKQVILYWYQSADRIVNSEYAQRISLVLNAILHHRTDGALIKVSAPVAMDMEKTLISQKEFIRDIYPFLGKSLSGE